MAALRPTTLVLDRKGLFQSIAGHGMKLDHIGPANEAEPQRPH
jgi:hypothetical protein